MLMAGREAESILCSRHTGGEGADNLWKADRGKITALANFELRIPGVDKNAPRDAEWARVWRCYERRLRKKTRMLVRRHSDKSSASPMLWLKSAR
jgi:hypothetical protein